MYYNETEIINLIKDRKKINQSNYVKYIFTLAHAIILINKHQKSFKKSLRFLKTTYICHAELILKLPVNQPKRRKK